MNVILASQSPRRRELLSLFDFPFTVKVSGADENMDLRKQKLTVGELLDDPRSRGVFQRRFGKWMKHPMLAAGRSLTLAQLMELAKVYLPPKVIQDTWNELKNL